MKRDLKGKTIIITGASSGIGAATAVQCAAAGMNLVLNARREDRLKDVAKRLEDMGAQTALVIGDVTEPGISHRMLDAAEDRFGGFHAVFANAGYGMNKAVVDETDDELRRMFDVNFFASVEEDTSGDSGINEIQTLQMSSEATGGQLRLVVTTPWATS